eukprot:TRINITY_DN8552_c0_g1_i1.p1 TRINITY_DN8552_c0_g1~~TRINITY_DN8552_c0_g1_i1.p1  ORF type:complete len:400 (+),score=52.88 TRINITY_DN8552_c0_g1_i1:568-1767(+)
MVSQTESRLMVSHGAITPPAKLGPFPLARQTSIYSLTLDEFQNSLGEPGKNFGSMNMDEFLKNIWTAEETQAMASAIATGDGSGANPSLARQTSLQREGSVNLARTWSRKTVDDVWREIHKEVSSDAANGASENTNNNNANGNCNSNVQTRQPTFGEMTLEDFLVKAGVVREEPDRGNHGQPFDLGMGNSLGLGIGRNGEIAAGKSCTNLGGLSLSTSQVLGSSHEGVNLDAFKHQDWISGQYRGGIPQQQQYLRAPGGIGLGNGGLMGGIGGFCHSPLALGGGSPASPLSSDGVGPSHVENPNLSPYGLDGGFRGRKRGFDGPVEKVVERRQRRMIKNRESAARSRARKQAYTVELEAEVTQLKEENKKLKEQQVSAHLTFVSNLFFHINSIDNKKIS